MKPSIILLGIAAILSACTQTDESIYNDNEAITITVSARLPIGIGTRAASDSENASIDRYVLATYIVDGTTETFESSDTNLTGIFSPKLDRKKNYRFYCWADEGDESSYNVTNDLKSISIKSGQKPSIAHRGVSELISGENPGETVTITMKHAVAKLVLMTTQPLHANAVTAETSTYTSCNAITGVAVGSTSTLKSQSGPDMEIADASPANPVEVLSMYLLVGARETFSVKLTNSTLQDASRTIDNVPFAADCRTIVKGDVTSINNYNVTLNTSLDNNWTDTAKN